MKRPERQEARSLVLHVRVTPSTHSRVSGIAVFENRKLSDMGALLLDEALEARARVAVKVARKAARQ